MSKTFFLREPMASVPGLACTCWRHTPRGAHMSPTCPVGQSPIRRRYGHARARWEVIARQARSFVASHGAGGAPPYLTARPEREIAAVEWVGAFSVGACHACNRGFAPPHSGLPSSGYAASLAWVHAHNAERHPRRAARPTQ